MTYTVPFRRTSLQFSQMRLTLDLTFMAPSRALTLRTMGTFQSIRSRQAGKGFKLASSSESAVTTNGGDSNSNRSDLKAPGSLPGQFDGVHQIHVDSERNLYVTEVANSRSQMFRPKPNADPNRLVGPMAIVNPVRTRK